MRQLLNTLYVTRPNAYLSLNGENVVVKEENVAIGRYPLHNIESIVLFSNLGMSPQLMGKCVDEKISICFLTPNGRFRARVVGKSYGNVLLRKKQYKVSMINAECIKIARNIILGKIYNEKWLVERYVREYPLRIRDQLLKNISNQLTEYMHFVKACTDLETLRGFEGKAQVCYFQGFNELILNQKNDFFFNGRNRRPPQDRVNSLLSFAYTLLGNDIASALETVGLDSYVGFMHQDRPGRISLALDMIEEFRAPIADRFVISIINRNQVKPDDFILNENGSVLIKDEARKKILSEWQKRKQEELRHPFLDEKISWGLVPYSQAMLLARYLRGDLDEYPPFFWK
ncbi:MAG: type I-C CRISPR-associated endonuclease Cas1 [Clostridiales bacterium]|jgi:CRISPR-associated protein Cas1|nr:type I-C CRISPR-associated endonuclease Cas1 [Clostridiales bacterium]